MRMYRTIAMLLGLASLGGGGMAPVINAPAAAQQAVSKNALPRRISQSKRATKAGILSGDLVYQGGTYTGYDWIYRRTNGFRRKGVGSRWRITQTAGRR
jgi:hypothetical protein